MARLCLVPRTPRKRSGGEPIVTGDIGTDYDREFPSLSGAPQQQYQNPGQAVWATANQRVTQHTPVQRPQHSHLSAPGLAPSHQQSHPNQDQLQQTIDDAFFDTSHITNTMDDYRNGGQGGVGQLSGSQQPQPSSIDDFPPLGRNGHGEIGQDRRGNMMQNAAAGAFPNSSAFGSGMSNRYAILLTPLIIPNCLSTDLD